MTGVIYGLHRGEGGAGAVKGTYIGSAAFEALPSEGEDVQLLWGECDGHCCGIGGLVSSD